MVEKDTTVQGVAIKAAQIKFLNKNHDHGFILKKRTYKGWFNRDKFMFMGLVVREGVYNTFTYRASASEYYGFNVGDIIQHPSLVDM